MVVHELCLRYLSSYTFFLHKHYILLIIIIIIKIKCIYIAHIQMIKMLYALYKKKNKIEAG